MTILDQIRLMMLRGESNEEAFANIPQQPVYIDTPTVTDNPFAQRHIARYELAPPLFELYGLRVYESPLCGQSIPARTHKQRMRKSNDPHWITKGATIPARGNYHKRIQKKWNKRYGFTLTPPMILTGRGGVLLIASTLLPALFNEISHARLYGYNLD